MASIQYTEKDYIESSRLKRESVFHTASGTLGIRGSFEEGAPDNAVSIRGAYLNGFCENEPITYNERLYGFAEEKQQIVNLPDAQTIRLTAGGKQLRCFEGKNLVQTQDMESGQYRRSFVCDTPSGALSVCFTRIVSFVMPELFAVECRVQSLGFEGELKIESCLNPDVRNFTDKNDPRVASGDGKILSTVFSGIRNDMMAVVAETANSKRMVACVSAHDLPGMTSFIRENGVLSEEKSVMLSQGSEFVFHKFTVYHELTSEAQLCEAITALEEARSMGFAAIAESQRAFLEKFWRDSRVLVEGNEDLQSQLDFCLYGMLSSAGRDGKTNVAAKGLSGEGYEGHYFWDSEIYIFPFFLTCVPETARALLEYRYRQLTAARAHARMLGHSSGALYPWRTITGSECSSHYPSGSAQYHINGDIAHAFASYWLVTQDETFLPEICEVLVETARLWLDTGHWLDGEFRIDCVTGPDEYTCLVNNNYYTNAGAAENLLNAVRLCKELEKRGGLQSLKEKLSLTDAELAAFRAAGEKMYYPHSEKLGIIAQDDSFLSKKRVDLKDIPKANYPLLMHYHPLVINRYQVLKQADSVLANHIYREEDILTMRRSYEYYEAITTHDSSLSNCIYAIVAARLGDMERAERYFTSCIGTDTSDQNGNTKDGLHIANMGGVYRVMTCGFGGVSMQGGTLSIFPILPASFSKLSFPVFWQGRRILVSAEKDLCTLQLLEGQPLTLEVFGQQVLLAGTSTVRRTVKGVVFDLDGVITDTAVFHYRAWKNLADSLGISFNEELNENFKGVSRAQCLKLLLAWGNRQVSEAEFDELLERKNNIYCEYLETLTPANILPGIEACLAMLKEKHIPTALFSVSKNTDTILGKLGLAAAFDAVVTGRDIQHSKPHYEGYLLSAVRLGVDPRLCMMVEDSVAGITGAKAVSMKTLAIMARNTAGADKCVPSTAGVQCAVAEMAGCAN